MQNKFTEVANKITTIKTGFAEAISAKGVETAPNATFSDMIANVGSITGGGGGAVVYDDWTKPHDWPDIEADPLESKEMARMLFCDRFNDTPEELTFISSQFSMGTIDWGDGTEPTKFSSSSYPGRTVKHTFDTNGGVYCESLGCKVYIVKVTFDSNNIPFMEIGKNSATYQQSLESGLLWFYGVIGPASFTSLFNSMYSNARLCQRIHITNQISRAYPVKGLFYNLHSLVSLKYNYALEGKDEIRDLFTNCFSLRKAPAISTASSTGSYSNNRYHFRGCHSLMEIGTITLASNIRFEIGDSSCKPPVKKIDFAYDSSKAPVFTETVPIKINYTQLDKAALDKLMTQLPDGNGKTLDIQYNPGSTTCDTSIATAKNWTVLV